MTTDFKATQVQTNKIIVTGSFANDGSNQLLIYNYAADDSGTPNQGVIDPTKFDTTSGVGSDVFLFVSGGVSTRGTGGSYGVTVMGGDLHVSGNLTVDGTSPGGGGGGGGSDYWQSTVSGEIFSTGSLASISGSLWTQFLSSSNGAQITGSVLHGLNTVASSNSSHAQGDSTTASGNYSHAEGAGSTASADASHAEGIFTNASGQGAHSEGSNTVASEQYSHAEGDATTASGIGSHSEGSNTSAEGFASHAEGFNTYARSQASHSEGEDTDAKGIGSHAEGNFTVSVGEYSHAEGMETIAASDYSHAEGQQTVASGTYSHAEGLGTISSGSHQHVQGKYNLRNNNFSLFVIGNGTNDPDNNRSDVVRVNPGTPGSGSFEVTGTIRSTLGFSGSLTQLTDGTPYLIAGSGIQTSTGSNGAVTITLAGTSGLATGKQYVAPYTTTTSTTAVLAGQFSWVPADYTGLSSVSVRAIMSTDGTANHTGSLQIYNLTSGSYLDMLDTPSVSTFFVTTSSIPTLLTSSNLLSGITNFDNSSTAIYEVRVSGSSANSTILGGVEIIFS